MRLKEEMLLYPGRVKKKISRYTENYCALIIAVLKDVTPEEAFLSLYQKRVFKLIRHKKYTTDDIYNMIELREKGVTLAEIAKAYSISIKSVWSILAVYAGDMKINEEDVENDESNIQGVPGEGEHVD
jgi:DNA invertase Pin-like site-specific DNA recombinase